VWGIESERESTRKFLLSLNAENIFHKTLILMTVSVWRLWFDSILSIPLSAATCRISIFNVDFRFRFIYSLLSNSIALIAHQSNSLPFYALLAIYQFAMHNFNIYSSNAFHMHINNSKHQKINPKKKSNYIHYSNTANVAYA